MNIGVMCSHIGSNGISPSKQHGGGELHTFAFLKILDQMYNVTALTPPGFYPAFDQANDYGLDLTGIKWMPYSTSHSNDNLDFIRKYDAFISINHGFLPPPLARLNILAVFFPQFPEWGKNARDYDIVIGNSEYTAKWIKRYWEIDAEVVYPPILLRDFQENRPEKKKVIASVGRFFSVPGGNNKNHILLIKAFQELWREDYELHMIGAVQDVEYYKAVREAAGGDQRIKFLHDISRAEYVRELSEAQFVWAATGYGAKKPSSREHFGIFPVEAMAAGAIPIVHNSGGTPETGCLTWSGPGELMDQTTRLIDDPEMMLTVSEQFRIDAQRFSFEEQAKRLVQVIEKPVLMTPNEYRGKIFVTRPDPKETTVAMWSDDPRVTTGFGTLSRQIGARLRHMGFNVVQLGWQNPYLGQPSFDHPWPIWNGCKHDPNGWENVSAFIELEKPHAWYLNYDPGNIRKMLKELQNNRSEAPIVAYVPIESAPVIDQIVETLRWIKILNGDPILYTRWAQNEVLKAGGPKCDFVHHGNDHQDFRLPGEGVSLDLRRAMGWENKFVVSFIGRNKQSKNIPSLLYAAKHLIDSGHNDFVWYIHTNPNESLPNSSAPLQPMADMLGLGGTVYFAPDLASQAHGPIYDGQPNITVPETNDPEQMKRYYLMAMSLMERLWLSSDYGCYATNTSGEGFGLCTVEAMGCGLPVVAVDDGGVQREVLGTAPVWVKPKPIGTQDTWVTGGKLVFADPVHLAEAILQVKMDNNMRLEMAADSRKHWEDGVKWDQVAQVISASILHRIGF